MTLTISANPSLISNTSRFDLFAKIFRIQEIATLAPSAAKIIICRAFRYLAMIFIKFKRLQTFQAMMFDLILATQYFIFQAHIIH